MAAAMIASRLFPDMRLQHCFKRGVLGRSAVAKANDPQLADFARVRDIWAINAGMSAKSFIRSRPFVRSVQPQI